MTTTAEIRERHNSEAHGLFPKSSLNALYQIAYQDRGILLDRLDSEIDFQRDILMKKLEAAENETRADQQTIIELTNMVKLFKSRADKAEQELSIEVAVRKQAVADLKATEQTIKDQSLELLTVQTENADLMKTIKVMSELPSKWRLENKRYVVIDRVRVEKPNAHTCAMDVEAILNRSNSDG